jgi:hypothetical protein
MSLPGLHEALPDRVRVFVYPHLLHPQVGSSSAEHRQPVLGAGIAPVRMHHQVESHNRLETIAPCCYRWPPDSWPGPVSHCGHLQWCRTHIKIMEFTLPILSALLNSGRPGCPMFRWARRISLFSVLRLAPQLHFLLLLPGLVLHECPLLLAPFSPLYLFRFHFAFLALNFLVPLACIDLVEDADGPQLIP